jgi:hypothetical protein
MRPGRHVLSTAVAACTLCFAAPSWAVNTTIDTVGGTASSPNTNSGSYRGRGNVYSVTRSTTLLRQDIYLSLADDKPLTFYVYESDTQHGMFSQVLSKTVNVTASGVDWYSSGDISVPLQAGKYYMMGFSLPLNYKYYFSTGTPHLVSFGDELASYANGGDPIATTISDPGQNTAIYYQRLTTVVPEPAAASLLAVGLGLLVNRRRVRA